MIHIGTGRRTQGKTTLFDFLCRKLTYQARFSPRITLPARGAHFHSSPEREVFDRTMKAKETATVVPDHQVDETFMDYMRVVSVWYRRNEQELIKSNTGMAILVDEARFSGVRESEDLDWLMRCTQQNLVHIYFTVHRPKDLHPDIRAIADFWYVFNVTQPHDLEVLKEECGEYVANMAPNMRAREFVFYDVATQKHRHWKPEEAHLWKPEREPEHRPMISGYGDLDEGSSDFDLV
jgi:hypothetical protein